MHMPAKILVALFLLLASSQLMGQNAPQTDVRFRGGIVAGLNATQVDGDDFAGFTKLGLNAGFVAQLPLSKKFFMSMEILYSQKGAKSKTYQGFPTEYRVKLNYAEVPVLINFQEKSAVNFGLGLAYGRLVKIREFIDELEQEPFEDFNRDELSGIANGNYLITPNFNLNVRWSYSIFPIGHSPLSNFNSRAMYNHVLSFRLAYIL